MGKSLVINKSVNFSEVALDKVTLYDDIYIGGIALPSSKGRVDGAGFYRVGDVIDLSAVPNVDCRFVNWSDGTTSRLRTVTVNAPATYTANFESHNWTQIIGTGNTYIGNYTGCSVTVNQDSLEISVQNTIPRFLILNGINSRKAHFVEITYSTSVETEIAIGEITTNSPTNVVLQSSTTPKTETIYIVPGKQTGYSNIFGFLLAFTEANAIITISSLKFLEVDI